MDYDSSTKFISSLAKFLQSLCNGYVEFDNGVQVIGHLYLNVDTGKTIDYVLNEKVCKTDENSVTFISNSFHAQPAEKPKPPGKRADRDSDKADQKTDELENGNQTEPRSTNVGTLPAGRNYSTSALTGSKRPYSPSRQPKQDSSKSDRASPKNKRSRSDIDSMNSTHSISEGMSESSPGDTLHQPSLAGQEAPSFSETYQQNFFAGDENSVGDSQDQRDIKPSFDTDVTFIKEEYAPPSSLQGGNHDDGSQGDSSAAYSPSYSNQQFTQGAYVGQGGFSSNQRSTFNPAGDRSMYNSGTSQLEGGDMSADPSVGGGHLGWRDFGLQQTFSISGLTKGLSGSGAKGHRSSLSLFDFKCKKCAFVTRNPLHMTHHKRTCNGKRHLTCTICSKVLSRYDALAEHMRGIHGIGGKVGCKFCGKTFKYRPQMYQHQVICPLKPPKFEAVAIPGAYNISNDAANGTNISFPYDVMTSASNAVGTNLLLDQKSSSLL